MGLCPTIHIQSLLAELCLAVPIACPMSSLQMAASSCCRPAWASSRAGMWSGRRWPRGCAGWRRRTSSSACSSARRRWRAATAAHSGGPLPRMGTPPGAREATARSAPSSGRCTSVRWVMAQAWWHGGQGISHGRLGPWLSMDVCATCQALLTRCSGRAGASSGSPRCSMGRSWWVRVSCFSGEGGQTGGVAARLLVPASELGDSRLSLGLLPQGKGWVMESLPIA